MTPAEIAARLTPAQRRDREAIMEACCGDARCWAQNDLDGWLPMGCWKCAEMADQVLAILKPPSEQAAKEGE
jgi:hypothetical protein